MVLLDIAAKYVAESRQHGCHYAEGTCDECRAMAQKTIDVLFRPLAVFDASAICPECDAPMGEHMLGGPYHPFPVRAKAPSGNAIRLVHKIRTYGHRAEFALTDLEAARAIENFSGASDAGT